MAKKKKLPAKHERLSDEQLSQFAIPAIFIVQGLSRMEGRKGNEGRMYHTADRAFADEVHLLIVDSYQHRAMRQMGYEVNAGYLCKSIDGVKPAAQFIGAKLVKFGDPTRGHVNIEGVIPEYCAVCPFARLGCNKRMTYRAIDVNSNRPVTYLIEKTRWDAAKDVNTEVLSAGILGEEYPVWALSAVTSEDGEYYVPKFERVGVESDYPQAVLLAQKFKEIGILEPRLPRETPKAVLQLAEQLDADYEALKAAETLAKNTPEGQDTPSLLETDKYIKSGKYA